MGHSGTQRDTAIEGYRTLKANALKVGGQIVKIEELIDET